MSEPEIYKDEPIPARPEDQDAAQPALFQEDMSGGIPSDPVRPQPGSCTHLPSGLRRYYPHAAAFPEENKSYGDSNSVKSRSVKDRAEGDRSSSIFIPGKITAIRSLEAAGPSGIGKRRQQIFYQQAMLMKDYEDSYRFPGTVHHYYPTYSSLDDRELRGYFGWRTRMRHGDLEAESLSYAYLYIYELLDQIGVADPEDGYDKLSSFFADYAQLDARIERYKSKWLQDYVVYYDLGQELLPPDWDVRWDKDIAVLSSVHEHGGNGDAVPGRDIDIFRAMADVSQYDITGSNFYKGLSADGEPGEQRYREAMETVAPRVFARISGHYSRRRKVTLIEDYFGHSGTVRYVPFAEAMFYSGPDPREFDYRLSPLRALHCRQGRWSVTGYAHPPGRNRKMDILMRAVDFGVRDFYKYPQGSTKAAKEKWISRIILEECRRYDAEYKRRQELNITFDYSRLAGIRKDADSTRDKLIVDENTDDISAAADNSTGSSASESDYAIGPGSRDRIPAPEAVIDTRAEADTSSVLLDPDEKRLVSCLLEGGDLSWMQERGLMLSVLADSINEKLYDEFADTVIDGGEEPSIINDYREDVRKLLFP